MFLDGMERLALVYEGIIGKRIRACWGAAEIIKKLNLWIICD